MLSHRKSFSFLPQKRHELCKVPSSFTLDNPCPGENSLTAVNASELPTLLGNERVQLTRKWKLCVTSEECYYDLNQACIKDSFFEKFFQKDNLTNPEVHVFWIPHVPLNVFRDINVTISCDFTATNDDNRKTLGATVFPVGLTSHSIFRPGHSIKLGQGEKVPWAIGISIADSVFDEGYTIAELYITLIGYKTLVGNVDSDKETSLISLVPIEETFSGVSFSRPRAYGERWIVKNYKLGFHSNNDVKKIMRLQELGFDTEAMVHMGVLKLVVKKISLNDLKDRESPEYLSTINQITALVKNKVPK